MNAATTNTESAAMCTAAAIRCEKRSADAAAAGDTVNARRWRNLAASHRIDADEYSRAATSASETR